MAERSNSGIWLERQADHIEQLLRALALPTRVSGGRIRERRVAYSLTPIAGTQPAAVQAAEQRLADALGAPAVHVLRERGRLALEIDGPPTELRLLPLMAAIGDLAPGTAVAGMSDDGRPVTIDFSADQPQLMAVSGPAGGGKSELLRTLTVSLALSCRPSQLAVAAIDPTGRELTPISALPHALEPLAITPGQALDRLDQLERSPLRSAAETQVLIVIDSGRKLSGKVRARIDRMVMDDGRARGVHWLIADPWPAAERSAASPGGHRVRSGERRGEFHWSHGEDQFELAAAWLPASDLATAVNLARRRPGAPLEPAIIRGYQRWL